MAIDKGTERIQLLTLIENEVDLGFTFLQTFDIASGVPHQTQAFQNAQAALETGTNFLTRLTVEEAAPFRVKFQELEAAIRARNTSALKSGNVGE